MAQRKTISTELQLLDKFIDTSGDAGTSGQVLTSTGTGINWVSGGSLPGGPYLPLAAGSGSPLTGALYYNGQIRSTTPVSKLILSNSSTTTELHAAGSGGIAFKDSGNNTKAVIDSSGNVGIGTTSPDSLLELQNSPAAQTQTRLLHIDNNPTSNQGSGYMEISSGTNNQAKTQIEQVSSGGFGLLGNQYLDTNIINKALSASTYGNINFATGSNTSAASIVMTIGGGSQKGNVGIGTTNPSTKLHISGGVLHINESGNSAFYGGNYVRVFNDQNYGFRNTGGTYIANISMSGNSYFNGGNVGIGTTSPSARLDIVGNGSDAALEVRNTSTGDGIKIFTANSTANNGLLWFQGTSALVNFYSSLSNYGVLEMNNVSTNTVRINSGGSSFLNGGNVGIGTTTPQRKLDVNVGTASGVGASFAGTISRGEYQGIHFGYSEAGNGNYRKSALVFERDDLGLGDATGKIHILNNAQNGAGSATLADSRVTILKTGNVGIGTTSPNSKLQIVGKATSSSTVSTDAATTLVTKDYVDSSAGNPSHFRQGFKTHKCRKLLLVRVLTVNLSNHTGCYVTVCVFW